MVDGNLSSFVGISPSSTDDDEVESSSAASFTEYELVKGLTPGTHAVTVWKATEDNCGASAWLGQEKSLMKKGCSGIAGFGGFSSDGTFGPAPAKLQRRLEISE